MATTVKTVDIQTYDANNKITTYKIDNPIEGITKSQCAQAFNSMIEAGLLASNDGVAVSRIGTVTLSTTIKETLGSENIEFNPSSLDLTINGTTQTSTSGTITVTNAMIQSANFETFPDISSWGFAYVTFNSNTVTVNLRISGSASGQSITTNLEIVIEGISYFIPVTLSRTQ